MTDAAEIPAEELPPPPPPPPAPRARIPDLGHTAIFVLLTILALVLVEAGLAVTNWQHRLEALTNPRLQLYANMVAYGLAVAFSALLFPLLWHRSFWSGIEWNARKVRFIWPIAGIALAFVTQGLSSFLPQPKQTPIEDLFNTPHLLWPLALLGTLIAPPFEEILFRGFLLPALTAAWDWLRLPKTHEAHRAWQQTAGSTRGAVIAGSLVTSLLFAGLHAPQLAFSPASLLLLVVVSLLLCAVKLRTGSVAASATVHACYNLSIFATLFVTTGGFRHL